MIEALIGFLWEAEPWKERAACKDAPAHLFFPIRGQSRAAALELCRKCPVKKACANYANKTGSTGIWGGKLIKVSESRTVGQRPSTSQVA